MISAGELRERQLRTLVASWSRNATGSRGATVHGEDGARICVFPAHPERDVYNNALVDRDLTTTLVSRAVDAIERHYSEASIDAYAVWSHESDSVTRAELKARGYRYDTSTRAMAMCLNQIAVPRPEIEVGRGGWPDYLRANDLPAGFLSGIDTTVFHVLIARHDGKIVGAAVAYDCEGDCGIYSLHTAPEARRKGLGTALTALHLHNARDRGCVTASVQSTEMAEGVYAAVGFADLGRYIEYVPSPRQAPARDSSSSHR